MMITPSVAHWARRTLISGSALLLLAVSASAQTSAAKPKVGAAPKPVPFVAQTLSFAPQKITLQGPYAEARVLVEGKDRTGKTRDMSGQVKLSLTDPKVATVDEDGIARARKDGSTMLIARLGEKEARIPLVVSGVAKAGAPRFLNDVLPVLTKAGCNTGACHGAGQGKGGFKLSLFGYDPDADYDAITRAAGARRIARSQPENSLFLLKPTLSVAHRGGMRVKAGSPEYRLLRDWIAKGLPAPAESEPRVTRLEVFPPTRAMTVGQTQRFTVRARYSNGTSRDVTAQTLFTASEEAVAAVTPFGEAKVVGPGEGAVLVRYQSLVTTARLLSPFNPPQLAAKKAPTLRNAAPATPSAMIDRLAQKKWDALGLEPSPLCSDSDFLRRAYLDVIGLLPTPEETRAFLADRDPKKREKRIDALLARPEYVDFWTLKWGDILRSSRQKLTEKGMYAFNFWIRESVEENKPWDKFARELVLAQGSAFENGSANYFRVARTPQELAETTSQVFLGVRIQCARCHNHPYEKWTQNQYYQMSAFFARMGNKNGERPGEQVVFTTDNGEVKHPKTDKQVAPCALDAKPVPAAYTGDRRAALADWLTSPKNPFFSRILVNRLWRHFLGRGFVEPVDDLRVTNPASNEPLFDWLAADFTQHGYDLKRLMRIILNSQTYQRAAEPTPNNARDTKYYSHFNFKRLGAEQLMDALTTATGVAEKFDGYPMGMRAAELPDTNVPSYFLELFGRPARNIACECERVDEPNLGQILHLMNNTGLNSRLSAKIGRVALLMNATDSQPSQASASSTGTKPPPLPDSRVIEELYLAALSRYPTQAETSRAVKALKVAKNRQQAAEDILWALLNSKEFLFNH